MATATKEREIVYEVVSTMLDIQKVTSTVVGDASDYYRAGDRMPASATTPEIINRLLSLGAIRPAMVPATLGEF